MSEAARSRRDDARYGSRGASPDRDDWSDPLAELARLVGQEDPFRGVFRPAPTPGSVGAGRDAPHPVEHDHDPSQSYAEHDAGADHAGHVDPYAEHHDYDAEGYAHPDGSDAGHAHGYADEAYDERFDAAEYHRHVDDAGIAEQSAADDAAVAALPDMWAQGDVAGVAMPPLDRGASHRGTEPGERSPPRRPLAVLAAVLVLTGGGLAASFLAKGPGTPVAVAAPSSRGAPVIMAATGPTKVKVEDPGATAPEDQDAALLNKNGDVSSGPVRIVSSQEQPADLSLLPKTSDLADGAKPLPPAAPSPFPEPKKVKTFVVHPDGTMLSADGSQPDAAAHGSFASDAPVSALPSTPRIPVRGGVTPKAATPAAPAAPPSDAAAPAPRQPASPGVHLASARPSDAADAPAAGAASYGLQLASSPVEADAQAAFGKLKKRYPALLGSLTASVHKAETGDKPVYRVRTGGMSQDDAKSLCSKLQGAGGSCLVVHN